MTAVPVLLRTDKVKLRLLVTVPNRFCAVAVAGNWLPPLMEISVALLTFHSKYSTSPVPVRPMLVLYGPDGLVLILK